MPPTLTPAFTLRIFFSADHVVDLKTVKGGPQRMLLPMTEGTLTGKGLEADLLPGGTDCVLIDPETQTAHLDTRLAFRVRGAQEALYMRYNGILNIDAKSLGPLGYRKGSKTTDFGDHEWFVTPVIETNEPSLKQWAESSIFLAEGRWVVEGDDIGVEYAVYHVGPSATK